MSELAVQQADMDSLVPHATETALSLPEGMSEAEWRAFGENLGRAARASAWWIGDWINYGERHWGEKYDEAERITGLGYGHLAHCAAVAKRFVHRYTNLSWTHHYRALHLPDADEWLARAEVEGWSVSELVARTSEEPRQKIMPARRHGEVIKTADQIARLCERWDSSMTDSLTPPEARKQLTILNKAATQLAAVIEAVEYRAATLQTFSGR